MLREFRDFVSKGNVIDLAVAVILGAASTAVVNSLVNDIIMPLIGILLGGIDLTTLTITIGSAVVAYGMFLQALINFFIIAFVVFVIVRTMNRMKKPEPVAPPEPAQEIILLGEIRDLLNK